MRSEPLWPVFYDSTLVQSMQLATRTSTTIWVFFRPLFRSNWVPSVYKTLYFGCLLVFQKFVYTWTLLQFDCFLLFCARIGLQFHLKISKTAYKIFRAQFTPVQTRGALYYKHVWPCTLSMYSLGQCNHQIYKSCVYNNFLER